MAAPNPANMAAAPNPPLGMVDYGNLTDYYGTETES